MGSANQTVTVRVSRRVLWIGSEAYPLHNIARVQGVKIIHQVIDTGRAMTILLILGVVIAGGAFAMGQSAAHAVGIAVIAAFVIGVFFLLSTQQKKFEYALIIETSGTPHRALVSSDQGVITDLVARIIDAISNPQAEFQVQVSNVQYGDRVTQIGNQNVGKATI
jgi:hypothetical protein